MGWPIAKKPRKKIDEREGYRPEDLLEAVCLVREEGMTIKGAAMHLSKKVVMDTVTVPAPLKLWYFIRYLVPIIIYYWCDRYCIVTDALQYCIFDEQIHRMTLSDWLKADLPTKIPTLGRPQEW